MATPFRPLQPFTEADRALFFGRDRETSELAERVRGDRPSALLVGESGIGKTSLVRASLLPYLSTHGLLGQYVEAERADVPLLLKPGGSLLVVDDVAAALDGAERFDKLLALLRKAGAIDGVRVLFVADDDDLWRLDALESKTGRIGGRMRLEKLDESRVAEILERTVLAGGAYFEAGLSQAMAADLAKDGPVSPSEIQAVATAVLTLRLNSLSAYRSAGGAEAIGWRFLERACQAAGGRRATRALAEVAALPARGVASRDAIAAAAAISSSDVSHLMAALEKEKLVRAVDGGWRLSSEWLRARARVYSGEARGRRVGARLLLRRKVAGKKLLSLGEVREVKRFAGALAVDEERLVRRSMMVGAAVTAFLLAMPVAATVAIYSAYAGSYFFDHGAGPSAPVVVRLGKPQMAFGGLPHSPPFGSVIADSGFQRAALKSALPGADRLVDQAAWLRKLRSALKPLPRGVVTLLVDGDLSGLKEAFADPALRPSAIEAIAAVGRGRPDEAALVQQALADPSEDVRRRAVAAAAALERRAAGSGAPLLERASNDASPSVRTAAIAEIGRLPDEQAAPLLVAAVSKTNDAMVRRSALEAIAAQVARTPAAAASLGRAMAGGARSEAATLLGRLLDGSGPSAEAAEAAVLQVAVDAKAPEEARLEALRLLRRRPATPAALSTVTGGPKLMAAAMPLMARANPEAAAAQVAEAMRGPVPLRAAAAATLGLLPRGPDTPRLLKVLQYDASTEVRSEAVRALPILGREALPLLMKEARDGGAEVERAAVETMGAQAQKLGVSATVQALEQVGRTARGSTKVAAIAALGRIADAKPGLVIGSLGRLSREKAPDVRAAAAAALGEVIQSKAEAARDAVGALRMAARDPDPAARRRAAEALGRAQGPLAAAAARALVAFAADPDSSVREASATALAALGAGARGAPTATVLALLGDKDASVRAAGRKAAEAARPSGEEVDKILSSGMMSDSSSERADIARTAGALGAMKTLRTAMSDSDPAVRRAAAEHATGLDEAHATVLVTALGDADAAVRVAAVRGLVGAKAAGPLAQAARSSDLEVRAAALEALGRIGGQVAKETLEAALGDGSERVRQAAARGLGHLGAPAAELLERALGDVSLDVREAAVASLGAAWRDRPLSELRTRLTDETRADVRYAAALALAGRADPQKGAEAWKLLDELGQSGAPLVRIAAQVARAFAGRPEAMAAFLHVLRAGG